MVGRVWVRNGGGCPLLSCPSAGTPSGTDPCQPVHAVTVSVNAYVCGDPVVFRGPCFLGNLHPL